MRLEIELISIFDVRDKFLLTIIKNKTKLWGQTDLWYGYGYAVGFLDKPGSPRREEVGKIPSIRYSTYQLPQSEA